MFHNTFRVARDAYNYFAFGVSQFRGVYENFVQAEASVRTKRKVGYNHIELAREYQKQFNIRLSSYDFPMLFYLDRILEERDTILDFGGNVGTHFLRYRKYLNLDKVQWIVCDMPKITQIGEEICGGIKNLTFVNSIAAVKNATVDIFIASDSVQYIDVQSPDLLLKLLIEREIWPKHILIDHLPLYEGPRYVTLQNGGLVCYPQYVFNRKEFIKAIADCGYEIIDIWDDTANSCIVPFHPEKSIQNYKGLYFKKS